MAYTTNTLSALSYEIGGRGRVWIYNTADSLASVFASGYISDAGKKRLQIGDMVIVYSGTLNTNLTATPTNVSVGTGQGPLWIGLLFEVAPQVGGYQLPDAAR